MGIFDEMPSLRTLRIGVYDVEGFNIPRLLESSQGLRNLEIHVRSKTNMRLSCKLFGFRLKKNLVYLRKWMVSYLQN